MSILDKIINGKLGVSSLEDRDNTTEDEARLDPNRTPTKDGVPVSERDPKGDDDEDSKTSDNQEGTEESEEGEENDDGDGDENSEEVLDDNDPTSDDSDEPIETEVVDGEDNDDEEGDEKNPESNKDINININISSDDSTEEEKEETAVESLNYLHTSLESMIHNAGTTAHTLAIVDNLAYLATSHLRSAKGKSQRVAPSLEGYNCAPSGRLLALNIALENINNQIVSIQDK